MKQLRKTKNYTKVEIKFRNFDNKTKRTLETFLINSKKLKINRTKQKKLIKTLIRNEFNTWLKRKTEIIIFLSKNPFSEQERKKWILELEPLKYETLLNIKENILIENFKRDNLNLVVGLEHIKRNR